MWKVPGGLSKALASRSVWFIKSTEAEDCAGWHFWSSFARRIEYLLTPRWTVGDNEMAVFLLVTQVRSPNFNGQTQSQTLFMRVHEPHPEWTSSRLTLRRRHL
jgi:hypothetical protein